MSSIASNDVDVWAHYDSDVNGQLEFAFNNTVQWKATCAQIAYELEDVDDEPYVMDDMTAFLAVIMENAMTTSVILQRKRRQPGAMMPIACPASDSPKVLGYITGKHQGAKKLKFRLFDKDLKKIRFKRLVVTLHVTGKRIESVY